MFSIPFYRLNFLCILYISNSMSCLTTKPNLCYLKLSLCSFSTSINHWGSNQITKATLAPLGDCILGVYFGIFFKKILKFFITLKCYGLHNKYIRNISFKKNLHLQVLLLFKTLVIMFSTCFWVFFIH